MDLADRGDRRGEGGQRLLVDGLEWPMTISKDGVSGHAGGERHLHVPFADKRIQPRQRRGSRGFARGVIGARRRSCRA